MTDAPQFSREGGRFTGFAHRPRRFAVDDGGAWIAASPSAVRRTLRTQGWRLVPDPHGVGRTGLTLLDSFDWRLASSGGIAILLENGEFARVPIDRSAEPDDPGSLAQRIGGSGRSLDRAPDRLGEQTDRVLAPRSLLRFGEATCEERVASLLDENGKTVALFQDLTLRCETNGSERQRKLEVIRIVPLRGFARFAPSVAGEPVDIGTEIATFLAQPFGRRPLDYETSLRLPLLPSHTIGEVTRIVLDHLLAVCSLNIDGIVRRIDPEFLHDFRVAIRRLRSYTKAVPHTVRSTLLSDLRFFWDASGRARDLDVFLLRRERYIHGASVAIRGEVGEVFEQLAEWRERAYDALVERLESGEFERMRVALLEIEPRDPTASAPGLAAKLHRKAERAFLRAVDKLVRAYGVHGEAVSDDRIHDARIKAKKHRYIAEIFAPLLPDHHTAGARSIGRIRKLQNLLGAYNDLVVEEKLFLGILHERPEDLERQRAGIAYMLAQVEREKAAARHRVMEVLRRELS